MTLSVHADGPFESRGAGQDRKRSTSLEAYAESPGIVPLFERGSYVTLSCIASVRNRLLSQKPATGTAETM